MSSQAQTDETNAAQTGAQRLARSRLAILDYLRQGHESRTSDGRDSAHSPTGTTVWRGACDAMRRHWEDHPAKLALELATPLLSHWGQRHPLAFLGIAAGTGAALVIARPWKLISVTGVLVAAIKSSNLTSLALSTLAARRAPARDREP
jgi:hypothetical protein